MATTDEKIHAFLNPVKRTGLPENKYKQPKRFKWPTLFFKAKQGEPLGLLLTKTIYPQ